MKKFLLPLLGCFVAAGSLSAAEAFKTPSFVKELEDLDKVIRKATEENKGVTFLLMEPGST
ncbi:MAG: hypothetical protein P1U87_02195 [Verrucomicrobiales bacterium]|nr:hypothetical protein [Verrucomicrobiales bacterium]